MRGEGPKGVDLLLSTFALSYFVSSISINVSVWFLSRQSSPSFSCCYYLRRPRSSSSYSSQTVSRTCITFCPLSSPTKGPTWHTRKSFHEQALGWIYAPIQCTETVLALIIERIIHGRVWKVKLMQDLGAKTSIKTLNVVKDQSKGSPQRVCVVMLVETAPCAVEYKHSG